MKNCNIDQLYEKIEKHILLLESYSEIKGLSFIIKSCRLKPNEFIKKNRSSKIKIFDSWYDEFGNSFIITKDKKIEIIYNDLSLNRDTIICTDPYYGVSLNKLIKVSKLGFVCMGIDEDTYEKYNIVAILGIDNYIRTFHHVNNRWEPLSPLYLGLKNLKKISQNLDIKLFKEINNKSMMSCIPVKTWISFLPASDNFLSILDKNSDILKNTFRKES